MDTGSKASRRSPSSLAPASAASVPQATTDGAWVWLMSQLASSHAWVNDLPLFHSVQKLLP